MNELPFPPLTLGIHTDTGAAVTLDAGTLERHVFVSGATGTGKTALLLALALQLLDRGRGVLFCTTKHDPVLARALAWAAWQRDRLWQLRVFDAMQPFHSYNPTVTDNPLLLVRQLLHLLPPIPPGSDAAYHRDIVQQYLLAATRAFVATGGAAVLDDFLQLELHPDLALPLLRRALAAAGALDLAAELEAFFDRFRIGAQWRLDLAQNALAGLTAALETLRTGRLESFFTTPSSELSLLRAIRKGELIYLGLPRAQDKESGRFGQLFLSDLDAAIQEIQFTEGRLVHAPFAIILDEFSSYAIPEFTAVFEQARSAGIGVVVSVQTPSALADQQRGLGREFRDTVVGNCGTVLSFRLGPGDGARYLAEYVGKAERWFPQESATQSRGRSWHILNPSSWFGLTSRTDQRMQFSGARMMKDQVLEARALTQELQALGEAYLLSPPGPQRLWTHWADAETAPADWPYRTLLPRWEARSSRPLDLGRRVRLALLARAGQAAAPAQQAPVSAPVPPQGPPRAPTTAQGPPLPPRPARRRQPIAPTPAPPGGRPARSRGQAAPRPGSAFTFVAPEAPQEETDGGANHDQLAAASQAEDILPDTEEL